jgi:hypothetical protein
MGISYDPTKPAANDKPANDQGPIQTNFASIKTLIDIDHVDFSNAYYGQHNQVTFGADNVPSLPTGNDAAGNARGILFTNTTSGPSNVNQLFYYAGTASQSSNQYYRSTGVGQVESSTFALGGIIIKFGTIVSATTGTINFNVAFPVACLFCSVCYAGSSSLPSNLVAASVNNNIKFNFTTNSSGGVPITYIAIGY